MQMCPSCERVYDESEYSSCPYCSGELEDDEEENYKDCPNCGGVMYWVGDCWACTNCGDEDDSDEDDYDGIICK